MIIHKTGDLFDSDAPVIGHGINCFGAMRAGIATQFSNRYPDMYEWYKMLCKTRSIKPGNAYLWTPTEGPTVANIASQWRPGPDARYTWAVSGIRDVVDFCFDNDLEKFAIPRIGCGIGGLDWEVLERKLGREFGDSCVDIEVWTL